MSEGRTAFVEEIAFADPASLLPAFAGERMCLFLDSAMTGTRFGRYAYLMADPFMSVSAKDQRLWIDGRESGIGAEDTPFECLMRLSNNMTLDHVEGLPPFQGGVAGLFGYDLGRSLERLPLDTQDDTGFPDLCVGFYDTVLSFDLDARRAWIVSTGMPEMDETARISRARERIGFFRNIVECATRTQAPSFSGCPLDWRSSDSRAEYEAKVGRIIDYILAGDIFQANLSQGFRAALPGGFDPVAYYLRLRRVNPAPFAAYLDTGDGVVASSSPERFLKAEAGAVETRPIKGTRPRGDTQDMDETLAADLLASPKDNAENVMIVDLLRNDLSRVCRSDSVEVPELCVLESYSSVHHLVSTVTGRLADGCGPLDLMAAAFPGGSITGAPKIRAMEIIEELEVFRRGPYCGSMGFIGFDGWCDTSILIRTVCIRNGMAAFNVGGGIVADSDPAMEFEETLHKARRIFESFAPDRGTDKGDAIDGNGGGGGGRE